MIGEKFGRITITEKISTLKVKAVCDCGNIKEYFWYNIKRGLTTSCGCFRSEVTSERGKASIKYGQSRHPLRGVWYHMNERCYNPKAIAYKDYGGRGITICDEWKNDFMKFFYWALDNGYAKGLEIDRTNNNGNYEPPNCTFVTTFQNCRNRRSNINITYQGRTQILKDWAIELGINYKRLHGNMKYRGKTFEESIKIQCKNS